MIRKRSFFHYDQHWTEDMVGISQYSASPMIDKLPVFGVYNNQVNGLNKSFTGYLDKYGICQCSVSLNGPTFPADRLERLEKANQNVIIRVKREISKIHRYESTLNVYTGQLKKLTKRVEVMEMGGLYGKLDFHLIKLEIREMETLIRQLKTSLNGSNLIVEALYQEIHNVSTMVNRMEVYDKNNVLLIRREVASLKKRLEACGKNPTKPSWQIPGSGDYGSCNHGPIETISKPNIVQANVLASNCKSGGWGKDALLGSDQSSYWVAPVNTLIHIMNYIYIYASSNDLQIYKKSKFISLNSTDYGQGAGMIMYNNTMYYNCYNSRDLCKHNIDSGIQQKQALNDAAYYNSLSYIASSWQDIVLAADEYGLWVIYTTEEKKGKALISKLDANTLEVTQTWTTSLYKQGVANTFMACGVFYATRMYNTNLEEIFYMYDTNSGTEGRLSVIIEKILGVIDSLSYNPNDRKLYMYDTSFLVTYDVAFAPKQ
ncbi:olfactomedin-like [Hyperolius riggenbachi]|uniref:olfactomedin-like n=1 Tax=Hyperolius riggenbachi TaxID=752182 RepID=UPI0035A3C2DE